MQRSIIRSLSASRFLTVSICIHVGLIALLGGVVLFKSMPQTESFEVATGQGFIEEDAEPSYAPEEAPAEFEEPAAAPSAEESTSAASAIATLAETSSFNVSTVGSEQAFGATFSSERLAAVGQGSGRGGLGKVGKIFGVTVAGKKLGVVLDVSFSTHKVIDIAIEEIQRAFPDAIIVLVPGCGMVSQMAGEVAPAEKIMASPKNYEIKGAKYQMSAFMPKLLEENPKFRELCVEAVREKRIFALTLSKKGPNVPSALVTGTHHAFRFLEKKGVDCIYWMADYEDKVEPELIGKLGADLQGRGIMVIQHDLDLKAPPDERLALARMTGGKVIKGDPQKLLQRSAVP